MKPCAKNCCGGRQKKLKFDSKLILSLFCELLNKLAGFLLPCIHSKVSGFAKIIISMLFCFCSLFPAKSADVGIRIGAAVYWEIWKCLYGKGDHDTLRASWKMEFLTKRMSIRGQLISGTLKSSGTFSRCKPCRTYLPYHHQ